MSFFHKIVNTKMSFLEIAQWTIYFFFFDFLVIYTVFFAFMYTYN